MTRICALVIPVYNEESRIDKAFWLELNKLNIELLILVNDASEDNSVEAISELIPRKLNYKWIHNPQNLGKAESVRSGMRWAVSQEIFTIATLDADGACAVDDFINVLEIHRKTSATVTGYITSGARVRLSGWNIQRSNVRQWLGRVVATLVSLLTKIDMYDPQTPLKIYSFPTETWTIALENPFSTRWFVDVEIILRFRKIYQGKLVLWEHPLSYFRDVEASHLRKRDFLLVARELIRLRRFYRRA